MRLIVSGASISITVECQAAGRDFQRLQARCSRAPDVTQVSRAPRLAEGGKCLASTTSSGISMVSVTTRSRPQVRKEANSLPRRIGVATRSGGMRRSLWTGV